MFYELSIQYDDPVLASLINSSSPASELMRCKVTHAYPIWIPSSYPRFTSQPRGVVDEIESNSQSHSLLGSLLNISSFLWTGTLENTDSAVNPANDSRSSTPLIPMELLPKPSAELSDFMILNYHRYLHLFYTYLDEYVPADVLAESHSSFVTSVVKILSPLAPQGNWTNGGTPPQPNEFFYRSFPKQGTNLDNDYHISNPGVFWGWFYLSRWLPDLIQSVLFPLDSVVYGDSTKQLDQQQITANDGMNKQRTPNARKLMGNQTPTKLECTLCEKFKGMMVWNRSGQWSCIYQDKYDELESQMQEKLHLSGSNDHVFFKTFNELIEWKIRYTNQIRDLEKKAFVAKDMAEMREIETQLQILRESKQSSAWFKSNYTVSVRG